MSFSFAGIRRRRQRGGEAAMRSGDAAARREGGGALGRGRQRCAREMRSRGGEAAVRSGAASGGDSEAGRRCCAQEMRQQASAIASGGGNKAGGARGDEGGENGESARVRSSPASKPRTTDHGGASLQGPVAMAGRWRCARAPHASSAAPSFFLPQLLFSCTLPSYCSCSKEIEEEAGVESNRFVARRMRHSLFHLDQRATEGGGRGATTSKQEAAA
ncbi:hypothetical protein ACQJBY_012008 [Aegilops geniculata]